MEDTFIGIIGLVLFILFLPYSLYVLLGIVALILLIAPTTNSRMNKKVERWSRGRKKNY